MSVKVQSEDFDIGGELAALTDGNIDIGGMVSFAGLVRTSAETTHSRL